MGKLLMKFVGVTLTLNPADLVFLYLLWIMRRVSESNGYRNRPCVNDRITAYAIKNNVEYRFSNFPSCRSKQL